MKKLKGWQIVLLVLFWPFGLVYLIVWIWNKYKENAFDASVSPYQQQKPDASTKNAEIRRPQKSDVFAQDISASTASFPNTSDLVHFDISVKTSMIEIKQKTPGALSILDLGYVSPSGGFVNYGHFRIVGINSATGRKNTRFIEAKSEEDARAIAIEQGLSEPISIITEPIGKPTEKQLAYALDLGASIPEGACIEDVSAIIERICNDDEEPPNPGLAYFAHLSGVRFSRCIGKNNLYRLVFHSVPYRDRLALYIYSVYQSLNGDALENLMESPLCELFYSFADKYLENSPFMKSLSNQDNHDIIVHNKRTLTYKTSIQFLQEHGVIK